MNGRSILSTGVTPCLPAVSEASLPKVGITGRAPRVESQMPPMRMSLPLIAKRPTISPKARVTTAM